MAEVNIAKQEKGGAGLRPGFEFDRPFYPGFFGVNPFGFMRRFGDEFERAFTDFKADWKPTIEVQQKGGNFVVTAELPGVKKEDIKVNVTNGVLTVEGERKHEKEEKKEGYYHSERSYGKFYRSIPLPEGAKFEQAAAHFNNGVLEIDFPVPEVKEKKLAIPVQEAKPEAKPKEVAH
jgi:HSP20 family protein